MLRCGLTWLLQRQLALRQAHSYMMAISPDQVGLDQYRRESAGLETIVA